MFHLNRFDGGDVGVYVYNGHAGQVGDMHRLKPVLSFHVLFGRLGFLRRLRAFCQMDPLIGRRNWKRLQGNLESFEFGWTHSPKIQITVAIGSGTDQHHNFHSGKLPFSMPVPLELESSCLSQSLLQLQSAFWPEKARMKNVGCHGIRSS